MNGESHFGDVEQSVLKEISDLGGIKVMYWSRGGRQNMAHGLDRAHGAPKKNVQN